MAKKKGKRGFQVRVVNKMHRIRDAEKKATTKSLGHAAGALRKTVVRSIRPRAKDAPPSKPGEVPKTPTKKMRRAIRYAVDKAERSATIGAVRDLHTQEQSVWGLHERGGRSRKKHRRLRARGYKVGEFGPIRTDGRGKVTRVTLATQEQAARASEVLEQANEERAADEAIVREYEKRPFMRPALKSLAPTLPSYWKNSVK